MNIMSQEQTMGYDRATVTFSPDGRIFQVEYAKETIKKGSTIIGVVGKDCVVLGALKKKSRLVTSGDKLFKVDEHIGVAATGYLADARVLIDSARVKCQQNIMTYDEPITLRMLAKDIADRNQLYTQHAGVRPYGVALLFGGFNSKPELFETNPSGLLLECMARGAGIEQDKVNKFFETHYKEDMDEKQTIKLAVEALKVVHKDTKHSDNANSENNELNIAVIDKNGYREFTHKD